MQCDFSGGAQRLSPRTVDTVDNGVNDGQVKFVFQDDILDPGLDAEVVVHFDDNNLPVDLVEVHAAEAVP